MPLVLDTALPLPNNLVSDKDADTGAFQLLVLSIFASAASGFALQAAHLDDRICEQQQQQLICETVVVHEPGQHKRPQGCTDVYIFMIIAVEASFILLIVIFSYAPIST